MEEQDDAPRTASGDPVVDALTRADALLSELSTVNLWAGSDADARARVEAVAALEARLGSFYLSTVYDLDTRETAVPGARAGKVAVSFLIQKLRRDPGRARADVEAARALADAALLADHTADTQDADTPDADSRHADTLDGLPLVGAAFAEGAISREHVDVAVAAYEKIPAHLRSKVDDEGRSGRARADELLADHARSFNPSTATHLAGRLLDTLDPEGRDRFDPDAFTRRTLSVRKGPDGMTLIRAQADTLSAAWIEAGLEHFSRQGPDRYLERQDENGDEGQQVLRVPDRRTKGQRQLDALAIMARLAMGVPEAGTCAGERPHISFQARLDTLQAAMNHDHERREADHGAEPGAEPGTEPGTEPVNPVSPGRGERSTGQRSTDATTADDRPADDRPADDRPADDRHAGGLIARLSEASSRHIRGRINPGTTSLSALLGRLICDSAVQTIVTGAQGQILDIGRQSRTVPLRLRKAVTARDHGCVICGAAPTRCDAHHVQWWRNHGPTALENLALLCDGCHTLVHLGIWDVRMIAGVPQIRPPDWLDPERRWWTPRPAREQDAVAQAHQLALDLVNDDQDSGSEGRAA